MKSSTVTGIDKVKKGSLRVGGWILVVCGVITLFASAMSSSYSDEAQVTAFLFMGLVLIGLGIFCFRKNRRLSRLLADFQRYNAILANDPVKTISRIAEMTGETVDTVRQKVNQMIEKGYFVNAYIDQSGKVVLADREKMNEVVGNNVGVKDLVTVTCPNCGGINRLHREQTGKCEFCGAYISDQQ